MADNPVGTESERLAVLEKQMERVLGNGRAGEIDKVTEWVRLEVAAIHTRIDKNMEALTTLMDKQNEVLHRRITDNRNEIKQDQKQRPVTTLMILTCLAAWASSLAAIFLHK